MDLIELKDRVHDEKEVSHIIHLADIHIRLNNRHEEYKLVFNKLYAELEAYKDKKLKCIIVICGDIVHSKIDLSPEAINITFDFFKTLSWYFPTFCIAGNHDALLNNLERIDSLSSVLYERTPDNFFYLKKTGRYQFRNIHFYVNSLLDQKDIDMTTGNKNINSNYVNIALYHGSLVGWRNMKGFKQTERSCCDNHINSFSGMDYCLLGDIHLYQVLSSEKPYTAYSSSLISQNFTETDINHGYIKWNLESETHDYIQIPNEYRYQEIVLEESTDENIVIFLDEKKFYLSEENIMTKLKTIIATKGKIRIISFLEDSIQAKEIFFYLKKSLGLPGNSFYFHEKKKKKNCNEDINNESFFLIEDENELINQYLKKNINPDFFHEVSSYLNRVIQENRFHVNTIDWKLKRIEFSYLFGYGENNVIDLVRHKREVIGVFGPNAVGKTSLIDIISMLCFDKCTRFAHGNTIPKEIINENKNEASGCIIIEIGQDQYKIQKNYKKNQKSGKIMLTTKFYGFCHVKQKWNQLTGEQRSRTNKLIEEIISNYDIFCFFNCFLQTKEVSFREMSNTKKKQFLNNVFGYTFYENLEKEHKSKLKELEIEYKIIQNQQEEKTILEYEKDLEKLNEIYEIEKEKMTRIKAKITDADNQLNSYHRMLSSNQEITNIDELSDYIQSKEVDKKKYERELKELDLELKHWGGKIENEYERFKNNAIFVHHCKDSSKKMNEFFKEVENKEKLTTIEEELKHLYERYNESELNQKINMTILNCYPLNEIDTIKKRLHQMKDENHLDSLHEQLNLLTNNRKNLEKNVNSSLMELQNTKESLLNEMKQIRKNLNNFKEMSKLTIDIEEYLLNHNRFCKDKKDIYEKFSPVFVQIKSSSWESWEKLNQKRKKQNISNLLVQQQKLLKEYQSEYTRLQEDIVDIHFDKNKAVISSENYKKIIKDTEKYSQPLDVSSFESRTFHQLLSKFESLDYQKEKLDDKVLSLSSDLKYLMEKTETLNKDCPACKRNLLFVQKEENQRELKEKKLELESVNEIYKKQRTGIMKYIEKNPYKEEPFHCIFMKSDKKYKKVTSFLKNLKEFHDEQCRKFEAVSHYKKSIIYNSIQKEKKLKKKEIEFLELEIEENMLFLSNKEVYDFIEFQWQETIKNPILSSIKKLQTLKNQILNMKDLREKKIELELEFQTIEDEISKCQKRWNNDLLILEKIKSLEKKMHTKQKYTEWLLEFEKHDKQKNQEHIGSRIKELETHSKNQREKVLYFNKNFEVFSFLKEFCSIENASDCPFKREKQKKLKTLLIEITHTIQDFKNDLDVLKKIKTIQSEKEIHVNKYSGSNSKFHETQILINNKTLKLGILKENKTKLYNLEHKMNFQKEILKILQKDGGLSIYLTNSKLALIETKINEMIQPFLPNKRIIFRVEDDKNIEFGFSNQKNINEIMGMVSGMEGFILDVCLKNCLALYSTRPCSNFFVIDEKISVLDKTRIASIELLFDFLKSTSRNVLLISHLESIKDFCDDQIEIYKSVDQYSHVTFK